MSYFLAANFITNYPDFFDSLEKAQAQLIKNRAEIIERGIFEVNVISVNLIDGLEVTQRIDITKVRTVDNPIDPIFYRLFNPLTGFYSENLRTLGEIKSLKTLIENQIMTNGGLDSVIEVQELPEKVI